MKNFLTLLLGVACVAVLFLGQSYWNQRIEATPKKISQTSEHNESPLKNTTQTVENEPANLDLMAYTSNWPTTAVNKFKQTLKEKKKFKILFTGSPAIGSDTSGSYPLIKEKLIETYGNDNIQVDIKTFDMSSTLFFNNNKLEEIAVEDADLIVLEPFILLNNGVVRIEKTLKDITTIMDTIKTKKPDTTFILQPAYPLYKANFYPSQVAELKKFAEKNQITYLDHWSAWPDSNTEAFKDYLQQDQSAPSEKGNKTWSEYIINYLISD